MEAAVHAWSLRVGSSATPEPPVQLRLAYTADRMLSSVVVSGRSIVLGAPEAVLSRCLGSIPTMSSTILPSAAAGSWQWPRVTGAQASPRATARQR
jgi:hypothetical protein